ncbi:glycosyltransferase family 2 protein [Aquabacterium parvum]|uniref:glycosyltransferase family 2 protein n=1 Tax=Aquabacterium parvum TaxID=70584 RepID=UPI000718E112|nr:glycosyltransferase [Aquabacterium parvum]
MRLVLSPRNGGFGAGVNIGVAALSTDLVLVLNPDTYFLRNRVEVLQRLFTETPNLGIAGLKLINPDGSLQYSARRFYSLLDILARRTPLGNLGPLRKLVSSHLLKRNWQVVAVPEVELVHEHQRHSQAGIWSSSGQTHLRSMVRFFTKFGVPWVRRPHRSKMKSAYLRWRRQVIEHGVGAQSDAQV